MKESKLIDYSIKITNYAEEDMIGIRNALEDSLTNDKLIVGVREAFVNNTNGGLSENDHFRQLMSIQFLMDNYPIFKNLESTDAFEIMKVMIEVMDYEKREILKAYTCQDRLSMIKKMDHFIYKISGTITETSMTEVFRAELTSDIDVVDRMKQLSMDKNVYIDIMIKHADKSIGNVTFNNGVVYKDEPTTYQIRYRELTEVN